MNRPFGPLQTARVLDFTTATGGAFASRLLADLGAQVIKVEPTLASGGGRPALSPPFTEEDFHFLALNRNKKSLAIDLKSPEGKAVFNDLVKNCDIVFYDLKPSAAKRLGLGHHSLSKINPGIISCSLTGFGASADMMGIAPCDEIVQGVSGLVQLVKAQDDNGRLSRPGLEWSNVIGAVFTTFGIASALYARERSGKGTFIDVARLDALMTLYVHYATYQYNLGVFDARMGALLYGSVKAKDKYIAIAVHVETFWRKLCKALGHEEWLADPRFRTVGDRIRNREETCRTIEKVLAEKTADEWLEIFKKYDVPSAQINSIGEAFDHPQLRDRDMVVSLEYGGVQYKDMGNPIKMSGIPEEVFASAPALGQHTREVLTEIAGYSTDRVGELTRKGVVSGR